MTSFSLTSILPHEACQLAQVKQVPRQGTALRNLAQALAILRKQNLTFSTAAVVDCGAGRKRPCLRVDGLCPTLTASRAASQGYYLTSAGCQSLGVPCEI